jgi:hypothetical protein
MSIMRAAIALGLLVLISGCAYLPIARLPADKEGALVIRCREVKGWFGRDSRWLMVVWVWSKTGTLAELPGNLEVTGTCDWSVARQAIDVLDPPLAVPPDSQKYRPDDEPVPR